jgi:hypothetical protein
MRRCSVLAAATWLAWRASSSSDQPFCASSTLSSTYLQVVVWAVPGYAGALFSQLLPGWPGALAAGLTSLLCILLAVHITCFNLRTVLYLQVVVWTVPVCTGRCSFLPAASSCWLTSLLFIFSAFIYVFAGCGVVSTWMRRCTVIPAATWLALRVSSWADQPSLHLLGFHLRIFR